jgi:large subunit ribosomal protein L9
MNIILLDHIEKVGAKHEVVTVKDGYGRNYLIPQGLAIVANKANLNKLEGMKKQADKKEAAMISVYQERMAKLNGQSLKITAKAGESGRLFGSIGAADIVAALGALGVEAEKRHITMPAEVKQLGEYTAVLKYHASVVADVAFEVVAESGE